MSYFCIREWEHHEVPRFCEMNCSPVLETHIQAHIYAQTSKSLPVTSYTVHAVIESSYIRDQYLKWKILMHLRCTALWKEAERVTERKQQRTLQCTYCDSVDTNVFWDLKKLAIEFQFQQVGHYIEKLQKLSHEYTGLYACSKMRLTRFFKNK